MLNISEEAAYLRTRGSRTMRSEPPTEPVQQDIP
jgi:hypothetical protein